MKVTTLVLVLALIGGAMLFASGDPAEEEVVTLSWWNEWSQGGGHDVAVSVVEKFNAANPGIEIVPRYIENEAFFTTMRTAFSGGQPPDVFQHESFNQLFQFVRPGEVRDLTAFWDTIKDRFAPGTEISQQYDGKVWGIPMIALTFSQIYYNVDLLEERGIDPPETWAEFLAACDAFMADGVNPIVIGNKNGWLGSTWFYALMARWAGTDRVKAAMSRAPGVAWTDDDFVQSARFFEDLNNRDYFTEGKVSDDYATGVTLFTQGNNPFLHGGSFAVEFIDSLAPPGFRYDVMPMPQIAGQNGGSTEIAWMVEGISIAEATDHPEAAETFLEYWSTPEVAAIMADLHPKGIWSVNGAFDYSAASPQFAKVYDIFAGAEKKMPLMDHTTPPEVGEENVILGSISVLIGDLTAEEWMANVEAAAAKYEPTVSF